MIAITDINELNKICRKYLISQSSVGGEFVRNALSTYGETLDKLLYKTTYDGISPCETLILFELKARQSDSNKSMTEADDNVTIYKSYTLYVIIYGSNSATIANTLIARLRTAAIRSALYDEGVYIESVSDDESVNEFKNNVMWHRHDIKLNISCMMSVEQVSPDYAFESVKINEIIKENSK